MDHIIEYKVHQNGNRKSWEETEVLCYGSARNHKIQLNVLVNMPNTREVRWNYEGSPQGHYVDGRHRRDPHPVTIITEIK